MPLGRSSPYMSQQNENPISAPFFENRLCASWRVPLFFVKIYLLIYEREVFFHEKDGTRALCPLPRTSLLFCTICARPNLSLRRSSPRFSIFPSAPIPTRSGGIPSVPPRRSFASSTGWRILAPSSAAASNSSTYPSSPTPIHSPPRLFSRRNIRQKSSGKSVNRKASSPPRTPPGTNKAREGFSPLALFDVFGCLNPACAEPLANCGQCSEETLKAGRENRRHFSSTAAFLQPAAFPRLPFSVSRRDRPRARGRRRALLRRRRTW